ncbi:methyltransferase family protein [Mucilaginibacter frigoritolerans]|jgi:ubiquinone/menaquinone biosynthesis C-methylase UbiE|uniref:Methyltransferase family protein n=1 Tax=Mucilaginibacter frigoritolerans TaxID=652788 RepID=A0A562U7D6_9SPHI|nr:class I SAM-dependent methyltransferase [Mucilaginibacter frigoritolerans]TWJ01449.1 methyltransferase family protein [Mucilaginibacter frigoritolerans]
MISDPTKRFTDRVDNYVKYRPNYPDEVISYLQKECGLTSNSVIADVGAGTGIFTGLLLNKGYKVYAVEPNEAMLQAAIDQYGNNSQFIPVNGTAEATTLPINTIDLIVCAQAFHWFNEEKTAVEFKRILKTGVKAALVWNNRLPDADEFSKAYENLLKQDAIDYNKVNHRKIGEINFKRFFKDGNYSVTKFPNEQVFDLDGLFGRTFSSSYVPAEGSEEGGKFRTLLKDVFDRYNQNGQVSFHYQTEIYMGEV